MNIKTIFNIFKDSNKLSKKEISKKYNLDIQTVDRLYKNLLIQKGEKHDGNFRS